MKILIALQATHRLNELKEAQRRTWLRDCPVDYRFFMGKYEVLDTSGMPPKAPPQKPDEVWLNVSDWKRDLSEKVIHIIRAVYEAGYDYLFKCDVDTYVHVGRLLKSEFTRAGYIGRPVVRDWRGKKEHEYAQGGAGFWMSRREMEAFLEADQSRIPFEDAEDIRMGWLLAEKGITLQRDWRYEPYLSLQRAPHPDNDVISTHKCSPEQMYIIHRRFQPGY